MPEKHPLQAKYPDLQKSAPVELSAEQRRRRGEKIPNNPGPKLEAWLSDLERIHTGSGASPERKEAQPQVIERIKKIYHRDYITGTDDDSVIRRLRMDAQNLENQGHGMVDDHMQRVDDAVIEQTRETIQQDQERSLDAWVDYLTSEGALYPMWFKYYVFRNIVKLAAFDKEKGEFPKRSKSTTAPFPDINREALAYMEDSLAKHYGLKNLDPNNPETEIDPQMKELLDKDANFASLYKRAIDYAAPKTIENLDVTDGVWIKFDQTADPELGKKLANSLHGHSTGWCVAGEGTASSYLKKGDFYVYYTASEDGQYSVPRLAIAMNGSGSTATFTDEIRGIENDQNIEGDLVPIARSKMEEINPEDAKRYDKKAEDMRRLTDIYTRHKRGEELSKEDLRFIYEIDGPIEGFGYQKDPRIQKITNGRDVKNDLSYLLDVPADKISTTKEEALKGGIEYHYGNLSLLSLTSAEGLTLPTSIGGSLNLHSLTSAEGLTLPTSIGGDLYLRSLTTAEGLQLPQRIAGNLDLESLTTAEGLTLPTSFGGSLNLRSLTSAEGLELPDSIGGYLDLHSLTSAEGLTLPTSIGGDLSLYCLTSAEGLTLPTSIGGGLYLNKLTSAEGLTLPTGIGGYLYLNSLTSAEGLELPDSIDGNLNLESLTTAEGLTLPTSIGGNLNLDSLTSAEGLTLPTGIGGGLNLSSLTSAEGLELPDSIGGYLNLSGLTSAEGLQLPDSIGSYLDLSSLTSAERNQLRAQRPDLADKIHPKD